MYIVGHIQEELVLSFLLSQILAYATHKIPIIILSTDKFASFRLGLLGITIVITIKCFITITIPTQIRLTLLFDCSVF